MVTRKATIEEIRQIIEKKYAQLTISVLGRGVFSPEELQRLEDAGIDTSNRQSLLSLVYNHNFINHPVDIDSPQDIKDMERQQAVTGLKPEGEAAEYTTTNINDKTRQYIEKMKLDAMTRLEAIIRENNDAYKMDALKNLDRSPMFDEMIKESTLGKVKQALRDTAKDANRDWTRVALTEMSNAIGISSVDRIVSDNMSSDLDDIYVYRLTVRDSKTCKYCNRFYNDSRDGSPKLYRLSTLLSNGSNFGKKPDSWMPVAGATHPNERCSQTIELKPGWKLLVGGKVTYIGLDKWRDYINEKLAV